MNHERVRKNRFFEFSTGKSDFVQIFKIMFSRLSYLELSYSSIRNSKIKLNLIKNNWTIWVGKFMLNRTELPS